MDQNTYLGLMALSEGFGNLSNIAGGRPTQPSRVAPILMKQRQQEAEKARKMEAINALLGQGLGAAPTGGGGPQSGLMLPPGANPAALRALAEYNPDLVVQGLAQAQFQQPGQANPWANYKVVGNQVLGMGPEGPAPVYTAPQQPPAYAPDDYEKYVREEQAAGRTPLSRLDYKTAGRAPLVSIGGESENEFNKATGKQFAERYVTMTDNAIKAQGNLASLAAMEQALSNPNVYTGAGGEQIQQLRRLAVAFGASPEEINAVADGEVVQSVSRQLALMLRDPSSGAGMPGAMSDADRTFLVSMVPGLPMSGEGNKRLIEVARRVSQRQIKIAEMAEAYVAKNGQLDGGFTRELSAFAASNPMFTMEDYNAAMRGMSDEELRRIAGE